jgi:hypothetical protein
MPTGEFPNLRDVFSLGGRIGASSEEAQQGQRAIDLLKSRNIPVTLANLDAARREVGSVVGAETSPVEQVTALSSKEGIPTRPQAAAEQQGPLAHQDQDALIPPEMASIRGELGTLRNTITNAKRAQDTKYKLAQEAYERDLLATDLSSQEATARDNIRKAEGALNTATEKLKSWEINPQRAFPTAFSKMAAVIGVSMGAYAQGLSGGKLPNTALQIVDAAIDRDIEAQKAEYQQLRGLVDEKRNVYGMAIRLLGDERQADEMARAAAYRSFNAGITSMSKQFGLSNAQNAQMLTALDLQAQENRFRASLMNQAAKGAAKAGKLPKEMTKVASSFESIKTTAKSLWDSVGQFAMGPASGVIDEYWPGEDPGDTFNRESHQALLEMLHAISGVAVREAEYARMKKFFPSSTKFESTNRADIIGLVDWGAKKGAGFYHTLPPHQKAIMDQATPELAQLYREKDPKRRKSLVVSILSQQPVGESGGGFFGEATQIKD